MNLTETFDLRQPLQALIDSGSRINSYKPQRYWYPLSMASYGVEEVLAAVDSLCSFRTTMWQKTSEFEQKFAEYQGCQEAIMVNSGSSSDLLIAFAAVNPQLHLLQPGDEVLVPTVTWPTQVWSAMMAGLKVRFVDTDPITLNVDIDDLRARITPRTKALFLVHLMGNPCDMDSIMAICKEHQLLLFEDCCESLGATFDGTTVGNFGLASSQSFFFSHHMTTMEGGMICCQDQQLSDLFRLLRAHGWGRNTKYGTPAAADGLDPRYMFLNWGFNVRPTELQAGFGLEQLLRLPGFQEQRRKNAAYFSQQMQRFGCLMRLMEVHPKATCSWFALPIILAADCPFTKDALLTYLEQEGVETRPVVAGNLTRQPVCQMYPELQQGLFPGADVVHERGFYLGLHPFDATQQIDRLLDTLDRFVRTHS